jgi:lipoprotein-anchoring transpeptidase ErfK/SrfK
MSRRTVVLGGAALGSALLLGACTTTDPSARPQALAPAMPPPGAPLGPNPEYAAIYAPIPGERFPVLAVDLTKIDPAFLRAEVDYPGEEAPGTIVVDPAARYLYYVQPGARAMRYGVGSASKASNGPAWPR